MVERVNRRADPPLLKPGGARYFPVGKEASMARIPKKGRTFAVIGLGAFGSTVGKELMRFENYVIGIDRDEKAVADHAELLSQALIADARDEAALREAGLSDCDVALIAMGEDLESSVLCAMNLKLIGVEKVWAKATSKAHHRILSKIGVDRIIHPESEIGYHVAQKLHNPLVRDYIGLGNGYHVVNFIIPEALEGRKLDELNLGEAFGIRCVGVMRGSEFVGRDGLQCELSADDHLLLLGRRANLRRFTSSL